MSEIRIAKVRDAMKHRGLDFLLLTPSTDLFWLTGMSGELKERLTCLVISASGVHFIAPEFELGNQGKEIRSLLICHGWTDGESPFSILKQIIGSHPQKAAIGSQVPAWATLPLLELYPDCAWQDASEIFGGLRAVKDETEYELLKRVHRKSNTAYLRLLEHDLCGLTELRVQRLLMELLEKEGLDFPGNPIVASGPNSALPHHVAGDRLLQDGDLVVVDFGGMERKAGYKADTTRTFAIKHIPADAREIYDIVLRANHAAFEAAKPGVPCEDIDRAARAVIENAGYGKFFTHRLGHGLGLDVHEHPYLCRGNMMPLRAGNVCSDEPGIYIPEKYGIRIEDTLFIHEGGAERLSILDHEFIAIN
ncbi:MAG: Xaa-Pro peptidase family protein [Fusobacteriaceae bacterium]|jgi:Xaa-Pro aminopeptidase|nr:Xaa-Pro peptidase family protein [Fusobacteriaceae bacterium]